MIVLRLPLSGSLLMKIGTSMEFLTWLAAIMLALLSANDEDRLRAHRELFGHIEWHDRAEYNESTKGES